MKCQICYQLIDNNQDHITCENCQVSYHGEELTEWLQNKNQCPNCKFEFDPYFIFELIDQFDLQTEEYNESIDNTDRSMVESLRQQWRLEIKTRITIIIIVGVISAIGIIMWDLFFF